MSIAPGAMQLRLERHGPAAAAFIAAIMVWSPHFGGFLRVEPAPGVAVNRILPDVSALAERPPFNPSRRAASVSSALAVPPAAPPPQPQPRFGDRYVYRGMASRDGERVVFLHMEGRDSVLAVKVGEAVEEHMLVDLTEKGALFRASDGSDVLLAKDQP